MTDRTTGPDHSDIRSSAATIVAAHVPNSATGLCAACTRSTLPDGCDAPEVAAARLILQGGRPEYRTPGANRLGFAYDCR